MRPAAVLSLALQVMLLAQASAIAILLVHRPQSLMRLERGCLTGGGQLAFSLAAVAGHALLLSATYSAAWKLDWSTNAATAQAAFPPNSTDTLSRLGTMKSGAGSAERPAVKAFDWSQFPDESSEEEGAAPGQGLAAATAVAARQPTKKRQGRGAEAHEYVESQFSRDETQRRSLYAVIHPGEEEGPNLAGVQPWLRSSGKVVTIGRRRAQEEEQEHDDAEEEEKQESEQVEVGAEQTEEEEKAGEA